MQSISDHEVVINDIKMSLDEFGSRYIPAYCGTTYKYQGATLNEHYNIYDAKEMNRNHMYVALSRCTDISLVHCNDMKSYYGRFKFADECEMIKPIRMEYGYIYEVKFDDDKYYIGETMTSIQQRYDEHINYNGKYTDSVYENRDKIEYVKQIAYIPVNDKNELRRYETYWIQHYEHKYGRENLLNKKQLKPLKKKETIIEINKTNHVTSKQYKSLTVEQIAENRFKITNDINKQRLRIQYRDNDGKKKEISKRYTTDPLDYGLPQMKEANEYMEGKKNDLILDLYN